MTGVEAALWTPECPVAETTSAARGTGLTAGRHAVRPGAGLLDGHDAERRPVGHSVTENTWAQTLLAEPALVEQCQRPAAAPPKLLDQLPGLAEPGRRRFAGDAGPRAAPQSRFVLLSLTGAPALREAVDVGWGSRVTAFTAAPPPGTTSTRTSTA
ncbi:hypothetical protein ACGFY8_27180 [Streptomyces sp. NPDC048232]|uniref:hypothetical protein n=1 Tax=Streptomyces sp. NPDC048232 TaxID=3365520 RepID=UPI00371A5368